MNEQKTFLEFKVDEVSVGMRFALDKHEEALDFAKLRVTANKAGFIRFRDGCSYEEARDRALREHVQDVSQRRYIAYKSALGKMFGKRRAWQLRAEKSARLASQQRATALTA